jgi:hypothetical protein
VENIKHKVLLLPCNANAVKLDTSLRARLQHVLSVLSTSTKIKVAKHPLHAKLAQLPNTKTNWLKAAAKTTFVRAQMEGLQQAVLIVLCMIQSCVLDVLPVKCCSQTKAVSNAVRENHLLVFKNLACHVLLASIKNKLSPLRTDAKHAGLASTATNQLRLQSC